MKLKTDHYFHTNLLVLLAERMQPEIYLELGIWEGLTFSRVAKHAKRAIGVDSGPEATRYASGDSPYARDGEIWPMTTDQFFESGPGKDLSGVELALIDACHEYKQALKDFESVLKVTAHDGLILFHDTYPENDSYKVEGECFNSYLIPGILKNCEDIELVTLPCPPGVTIVRKIA